jgi:hypothetical protein
MSLFLFSCLFSFIVPASAFIVAFLVKDGWPFHRWFAIPLTVAVFLAVWGIIFLIWRFFIKRGRPFCLVSKERCFIIQEDGGKPELVVSRITKKNPRGKNIFSRKDMRLIDFTINQFQSGDQFHLFPVIWSDKAKIESKKYSMEVEMKYETVAPSVDFIKYCNGKVMKEAARKVVEEAAEEVAGVKIKPDGDNIMVIINEIESFLKERIDKKIKDGGHLFRVTGLWANILLPVPSSTFYAHC